VPQGATEVSFGPAAASKPVDARPQRDISSLTRGQILNGESLHASSTQYQWINAGYILSFAVLLIADGRLGDIVGRRRMFLGGLVTGALTIFLFFGACSGVFIVAPLLQQLTLGWSALHAGLTGAWWSLGTILAMAGGQALVRKFPRRVLMAGLLILAAGLGLTALTIAHYKTGLSSWNLAAGLIVSGFGMGLVFAPFFGIVLSAVDDRELGSANGMISALDQLGGAVALAVMSTVYFNKISSGATPFASAQFVYWLSAGILVLTWALAFFVPKTARSEDETML
jgi:MFS family permease